LLSSPPYPVNLQTGAVEGGRQGRRLGGNCVGVIAASLPGEERPAEPEEKDVIVVFVGFAADCFFFQENSQKLPKSTIGDHHATLKVIQGGVKIAELSDLPENCWHCTWKFDRIGDCVIRHVKKSAPLCCSSVQFFAKFQASKKRRSC